MRGWRLSPILRAARREERQERLEAVAARDRRVAAEEAWRREERRAAALRWAASGRGLGAAGARVAAPQASPWELAGSLAEEVRLRGRSHAAACRAAEAAAHARVRAEGAAHLEEERRDALAGALRRAGSLARAGEAWESQRRAGAALREERDTEEGWQATAGGCGPGPGGTRW